MWPILRSAAECAAANVTYDHRVQDEVNYNFCVVPHSGNDAILLISVSILVSCVCSGQLSALYVLLLGAVEGSRPDLLFMPRPICITGLKYNTCLCL